MTDDWLDQVNTKAAYAMVNWVKAGINLNRAVCTLPLDTWKGMAAAAWSAYIKALSETDRNLLTPKQEAQLELWLG